MAMATTACSQELAEVVQMARTMVLQSRNSAKASVTLQGLEHSTLNYHGMGHLSDCVKLYDDSEYRLSLLLYNEGGYTIDDARTWLSGVMTNHRTCLEGLGENGFGIQDYAEAQNLTALLSQALALCGNGNDVGAKQELRRVPKLTQGGKLLSSWNPATSRADIVVAKDGSGNFKTINEAVAAVARMGNKRPQRVIVHVKAGVYNEKVDIDRDVKNLMLVGDGIDRTIVTGNRNVPDGASTYGSATFGVSGDGFWARDITFENTAGPNKHQAVAIRVSSDHSVFYRCSFRGYQDTLFVHSLRQFYRDCQIYGTIDFIFGDAPAVIQNCDILVRRPMNHQANMITAQGREDPNQNTGISIQGSRVRAAPDLDSVKHQFKTYLGRPWKKYSRTVFLKTDLDGLIDPQGWREWSGDFALRTLYYAEYMNTGSGASTGRRVNWPGFHVLDNPQQASPFAVSRFIQGELWIPDTGVPFWSEI
ncbi:Pectinesterase, catalytic [Corchorus olitorius]|uniref:Pectinesterase n=1 Tax=Corchorus olitorius TaxID=93759 RepID=A0A1R3K0L4_9ROSI|nr:Pectinesterase, catalytic [Corchorus olitorius]